MDGVFSLIAPILQITLIDIVLSGDNIGLIALAIKNLPKREAKLAALTGITGAIGFRIFLASILTLIMKLEWLPIKLIGGLLLLKITWDMVHAHVENHNSSGPTQTNFWKAVSRIIIADLSMSLDNVLAIASVAQGNILLIAFGIALNLPIIFFGAHFVANLMEKYQTIIYIAAGILIHTAVDMVLEDPFIHHLIPQTLTVYIPWLAAIVFVGYMTLFAEKEYSHMKNH